jgi:hypothetical protein
MLNVFAELPFDRVWLPFIYLYGVGGLFFFGSLWLVVRAGAFRKERTGDRVWLKVLLFGFFWYAAIHGGITIFATS